MTIAAADELAAAASLDGQASGGTPVIHACGFPIAAEGHSPTAMDMGVVCSGEIDGDIQC